MTINECWAQIDGQRMHYLKAGSGPPLLLIHGLMGGSFEWRFSVPVLAEHYTVHAVDLPGVGMSSDGVRTDCSLSRQVDRLNEFIEQQGWTQASVMGISFGGAMAMLLAAHDAQTSRRIRSLVLSCPVNPWSDFGQDRIRFLSTWLGGCFLRLVLPISRPLHRSAIARMYGDPTRMPQDALDGYRVSVLRRGRAANVLTALRSWNKDVETLRGLIPQIKIPALLIWGTRDTAVDPRSAEILHQHLPKSELKWIEGAGHFVFEERPEEFNRLIVEFLNKTEAMAGQAGKQ